MATLLVAALPASIGPVATAAIGIIAAYVDQRYIYPELFGRSGARPHQFGNLQIGQSSEGTPRWMLNGKRNYIPAQYLWVRNVNRAYVEGSSGGKSERKPIKYQRADVGIGLGDGPALEPVSYMFADGRPFLATEFDRVFFIDHRWTVEVDPVESTHLRITTQEGDQPNFASRLAAGLVVRLAGFDPSSIDGYWRVVTVTNHQPGGVLSDVQLSPLEGQTAAAGTAGHPEEPATITRIDNGGITHDWLGLGTSGPRWLGSLNGGTLQIRRNPGSNFAPGVPNYSVTEIESIWIVGAIYKFSNWQDWPAQQASEWMNGEWKLTRRFADGALGAPPINEGYVLWFERVDPTAITAPASVIPANYPGPEDDCGRILRLRSSNGLIFDDPTVTINYYRGDPESNANPDPVLVASEPNAPNFHTLSYLSLEQWEVSKYGRFPELTAQQASADDASLRSVVARIVQRVMPDGTFSTSLVRPKQIIGYPVQGGLSASEALQPLHTYYGLQVQDRGGVLTWMDERDLPLIQVPTYHMNARPTGGRQDDDGFNPQRGDDASLPQRVLLHFNNPVNEGGLGVVSAGVSDPEAAERGGKDTLDIDIRPLAVWPFEGKQRINALRKKILDENVTGSVKLPPSYLDVLPGHRLQLSGANWHVQDLPATTTYSSLQLELRDLVPGRVELSVWFTSAGAALLLDDGNGVFSGFPSGVTASVNSINYTTGVLSLSCSEALDTDRPGRIRYRWEQQQVWRVGSQRLRSDDLTQENSLVLSSAEEPLPPVPMGQPLAVESVFSGILAQYQTKVIDLPPIYQGLTRAAHVAFAVARQPGGRWQGALVYHSTTGLSNWSLVGSVNNETPMGLTVGGAAGSGFDVLPVPDRVDHAMFQSVDWTTEFVIQSPMMSPTNVTLEQIGLGQNTLMIGDEVISFLEAEDIGSNQYRLRGIIRGRFGTQDEADHSAFVSAGDYVGGEQVVDLSGGFGFLNGSIWEVPGGFSSAGQQHYFAVIPSGTTVEQFAVAGTPYGAKQIVGRSMRPGIPVVSDIPDGDAVNYGDLASFGQRGAGASVFARWARRGTGASAIFGQHNIPQGDYEQYVVEVYDEATRVALSESGVSEDDAIAEAAYRRWIVGTTSAGSTVVYPIIEYTQAEIAADIAGFPPTGVIGVSVYQRGAGGRSPRSYTYTGNFS